MKIIAAILLIVSGILSCNPEQKKTDNVIPVTTGLQELEALYAKFPDSLPLAEDLAAMYEANENYPAAISILNKQAIRDSTNGRIYTAIGFLYYEQDDTANAISYYKKAMRYSADPKVLIALGILEAGKGNATSLILADQLLQQDRTGNAKEAYYIQGVYYSRAGKNETAIKYFDQSLSAAYTFTNAYLEKAAAQAKMKDFDAAISTLDRGITVQNNFPDAYYAKGLYLEQTGQNSKALQAYEKAILYDPEFTEAIIAKRELENKKN